MPVSAIIGSACQLGGTHELCDYMILTVVPVIRMIAAIVSASNGCCGRQTPGGAFNLLLKHDLLHLHDTIPVSGNSRGSVSQGLDAALRFGNPIYLPSAFATLPRSKPYNLSVRTN